MAEQEKLPTPALPVTTYTTKQANRWQQPEVKKEATNAASKHREELCKEEAANLQNEPDLS